MSERDEIDQVLNEIEGKRISREIANERIGGDAPADDVVRSAQAKRADQVKAFQLNLDLDGEDGAPPAPAPEAAEAPAAPEPEGPTDPTPEEDAPEEEKAGKKNRGCLKRIIYVLVIMVISLLIAYAAILFLIDSVGLKRTDNVVDVEIPAGATTQQIADILHDKGMIEYPVFFRVFSKITKSDGKYQQGTFTLTQNMGYSDIVDALHEMIPRETVTVTIPEGYTVPEIAKLLAEKEVCTSDDFYDALLNGSFDYDFLAGIPKDSGRIYRLEGYLFPDTYNFYKAGSGETAVNKLLDNFNTKVNAEIRSKMTEQGYTLDEAIILASVIQGEAAKKEDMHGVARVLLNRLAPDSGYPKLQCDSTRDYVKKIMPDTGITSGTSSDYDTYVRDGLPVGAINNPGMDAINALLAPSTDKDKVKCYFFATDYDTGITYFSETFAQHERICRRYKIGAYG